MSIALWKLDASWIYSKGTYKGGVSYVLAYQVYNNSWSSFNTIPTPIPPHFHPEPSFDPGIDSPPSPHHPHTIAQLTGQLPLGTISRPVAPSYDQHSLTGEEEKDSSHYLV